MITCKEQNTVYVSSILQSDPRFSDSCEGLIKILDRHYITHKYLNSTKDIWCRDYMPIQIDQDRFVQFRYEPSYLIDDLEHQSDPKIVCKENNINPQFSNINIDGGNIVNWSDRAIITDRVFDENPSYLTHIKPISEIEKLLEVEVIIIPQINSDFTGHADGLVRFVDHNTILGNNRDQEFIYWKKKINRILLEHNIDYIDIPFLDWKDKKHPDSAIGCYVNFLEIGNLILLPIFDVPKNKDEEVFNLIRNVYKDRIVETINFNEIGLFGGLLNCTTWTIMELI